jgi:hypothetical protein
MNLPHNIYYVLGFEWKTDGSIINGSYAPPNPMLIQKLFFLPKFYESNFRNSK